MSNLIREQRLDKNGVLNTKLVRAESKGTSSRLSLPSPSLVPSPGKVKISDHQQSFLDSLDRQRSHHVTAEDWRSDVDPELRALCSGLASDKKLKCSDGEIFDVLSVVSEENVLPLLSAGVRSGKQAKKLLRANGLDRLLVDNKEQVKNLKYWCMHPRKAVMPPKAPASVRKDMYGSFEGYGSLTGLAQPA